MKELLLRGEETQIPCFVTFFYFRLDLRSNSKNVMKRRIIFDDLTRFRGVISQDKRLGFVSLIYLGTTQFSLIKRRKQEKVSYARGSARTEIDRRPSFAILSYSFLDQI